MNHRARPGFAIHEIVAACGALAIALAVAWVAGDAARRASASTESLNNLRTISGAYAAWAADHADEFATFTWRAGENPTEYDDLRFAETDLQAASNQAVDIIRRRAGQLNLPRISGWIPHVYFNTLVLADAMDWDLPARFLVAPEDSARQCWQINERDFCDCPESSECYGTELRWPYSASYVTPPMFYSSPDAGEDAIVQGTVHYTYFVTTGVRFGGRRVSDVRFPSDKAHLLDTHDRRFPARQPYFMYEEARVPVMRVDGSGALQTTSESNPGWDPRNPSGGPRNVRYLPLHAFDHDVPDGQSDRVIGHYYYTRQALQGRDFDGPEIPTE